MSAPANGAAATADDRFPLVVGQPSSSPTKRAPPQVVLAAEPSPPHSPATITSTLSSRRSSHFDVILGTTPTQPNVPFGVAPTTGSVPAKRRPSASPPTTSEPVPPPTHAGLRSNGHAEITSLPPMQLPTLAPPREYLFPSPAHDSQVASSASSPYMSAAGETAPSRSGTGTPSSLAGTTGPPSPSSLTTSDGSSRKRARMTLNEALSVERGSDPAGSGPSATGAYSSHPPPPPFHVAHDLARLQPILPPSSAPALFPAPMPLLQHSALALSYQPGPSTSSGPSPVAPREASTSGVAPPPVGPCDVLAPLPLAFASHPPATHPPFVVPFPPPFNSSHTPFVPTLQTSVQTSLIPLMHPDERKVALELELLPLAYLRLKAEVESAARAEGGDEAAKEVISGWKSGGNKGRAGRKEGAMLILEYLAIERQRRDAAVKGPKAEAGEDAVGLAGGATTNEPMSASSSATAISDAPVKVEGAEGTLANGTAAPSAVDVKGKGKESGAPLDVAGLAFGMETREGDAYSIWVFLQGYVAAQEVEQADIKAVVRPLADVARAEINDVVRSILPPGPRKPRKSGKPHREPKLGPFARLDRVLTPVAPLPTVTSAFHAAWLQTTADSVVTDEQRARFERYEAQLYKAEEAQRAREARWIEKREPRKSLPAPAAVATPSPGGRQSQRKMPPAKRRKTDHEGASGGQIEWTYSFEEAPFKPGIGRALTIHSASSRDPSVATSQIITLNSFTAMLATVKGDLGKIVFETFQSLPPSTTPPLLTPTDFDLFPTLPTIFLLPLPSGSKNPSALFRPSKDISPLEMESFYPAMFHAIERRWKEEGRVRDLLMLNVLYKTCQVKRSAMRKGGVYQVGRGVEPGVNGGLVVKEPQIGVGRGNGRRKSAMMQQVEGQGGTPNGSEQGSRAGSGTPGPQAKTTTGV